MATTTDDFHEIQLNGKQLVFLGMAVLVASVVIFLLGVLVGRDVRGTSAAATIAELTTTTTLPPTPDPGSAAPVTPGGAPATANESLSYPGRLSSAQPTAEKLREGASVAPPAPPPAATAPAPTTGKPPTAPAAATRPAPPTAPPATTATAKPPVTEKPVTAPPATKPTPATASGEPAGAGFAIQVAALRERNEADTIVRRLSGKGYAAYVIAPSAGTPTMYRVRVGKFKERREADAVAARLQKEEQFKPWIVR